jgi:predicted  nucleic acid-binding Zn-ribbon protein
VARLSQELEKQKQASEDLSSRYQSMHVVYNRQCSALQTVEARAADFEVQVGLLQKEIAEVQKLRLKVQEKDDTVRSLEDTLEQLRKDRKKWEEKAGDKEREAQALAREVEEKKRSYDAMTAQLDLQVPSPHYLSTRTIYNAHYA